MKCFKKNDYYGLLCNEEFCGAKVHKFLNYTRTELLIEKFLQLAV